MVSGSVVAVKTGTDSGSVFSIKVGIISGSAFAVLSEIREAYRKRAMRIKYMTYLIETNGRENKQKSNMSLKVKRHKFK